MTDTTSTTRWLLRAALPAALSSPALAHPGHEHTLANLFDLMHVGGALLVLALCATGLTWLHRRRTLRRAALRAGHNE